jgi:hypothetical protein
MIAWNGRNAVSRYNPFFIADPSRRFFMGYNRSGKRRTDRMKRAKKQEARLAAKTAAAEPAKAAAKK